MSQEPTHPDSRHQQSARPARRGRPRKRWARLGVLSALLSIATIALSIVFFRDAAVLLGVTEGQLWTGQALEWLNGTTRDADWLWPASVIAILLGLWFLWWALSTPQEELTPLADHRGVYLRPSAARKLAHAAADDVSGVDGCSVNVSRKKCTVTAHTTGGSGIRADVESAVKSALAPVGNRYSVKVNTKGLDE